MRSRLPTLSLLLAATLLLSNICSQHPLRVTSPAEGEVIATLTATLRIRTAGVDAGSLTATLNGVAIPLTADVSTYTATTEAPPASPLRVDNLLVVTVQKTGSPETVYTIERRFRWLPPGLGTLAVRDAVELSQVPAGESRDATLAIRNDGAGPLTISAATSGDPAFSILAPPGGGLPLHVDTGASRSLSLRFVAPAGAAGTSVASQLVLESNDPLRPTRTVQLAAHVVPPPAAVNGSPVIAVSVSPAPITSATCADVSGSVEFHAGSQGGDSFQVHLVDLGGTRASSAPISAPAGAGSAAFGGIDACALADGALQLEVEVTRGGASLPVFPGETRKLTAPLAPPVVFPLAPLVSEPRIEVCGQSRENTTVRVATGASVAHVRLGDFETDFCVLVDLRPNAHDTVRVSAIDDLAADPKPVAAAAPEKVAHVDFANAEISHFDSRALSPAEIEELVASGVIELDDPDDHVVSQFSITFTIGPEHNPQQITIERPFVLPKVPPTSEAMVAYGDLDFDFGDLALLPETPPFPQSGWLHEKTPQPGPPRPPFGGCCSRPFLIQAPTGEVIPGVISIGGNTRSLKELFPVSVLLYNATAAFDLSGVEARIVLPAGLTAITAGPDLDADALNAVGEESRVRLPSIAPGDVGHAQFLVRGDAIGLHRIDVAFEGHLGSDDPQRDLPFGGAASTTVAVQGPPKLGIALRHPATVNALEIYELLVEIQNLADRPAVFTSLELFPGSGVELVDGAGEPILDTIGIREIGRLDPGQTTVSAFRVRSTLGGDVRSCQGIANDHLWVTIATGASDDPCPIAGTRPASFAPLPPDAAPALLGTSPAHGAARQPQATTVTAILTPEVGCVVGDSFENVLADEDAIERLSADLATPGSFYLEELDATGSPVRHVPTVLEELLHVGGATAVSLRLGLPGHETRLQPRTTYRATLVGGPDGVCSAATPSARLPASVVWSFRTGPACDDATAPSVQMSDPPDGSIDRPLDQRVRLDFSEAIDAASLFFDAFQVSQPGTSSLSLANRRLTFVPSEPLPPSTTVLVELTEDVADACGNPLSITGASVQTFAFTTAPPDTTPPAAPLVNPVPALTNGAAVLVTGNAEPGSSIAITGGAAPASGTTNDHGAFAVSVPLVPGASHALSVVARDGAENASPAVATDVHGALLVVQSDVARPAVTSTFPVNGATGVPLAAAIEIAFDEPLAASSVHSGNFEVTLDGNPFAVTLELVGGNVVRFSRVGGLVANGDYAVRMRAGGVRDLAGNSLGNDFVLAFSTTVHAPTISAIQPAIGQSGTTVPVTLFGQHLASLTSIAVGGIAGITLTDLGAPSNGQRNLSLTIRPNAAPGARVITVTNAAGSAQASFTVFSPPGPPTISRILPGSGLAGQTVTARIEGTNLITATDFAVDGTGVTVTDLGTISNTHRDVQFTIAADATPGPRQVTVTTTVGVATSVFAVATLPNTPTVTWVGPPNGSWSVPEHWSTGALPTASDHVLIQSAGVVTMSTTATVRSLTLLSELSVGESAGRTLTIDGQGVAPALVVPGGARLVLRDRGSVTIAGGASLDGVIRMTGAGAVWFPESVAVLTLSGDHAITGTGELDLHPGGNVSCIPCNVLRVADGTTTIAPSVTLRGSGTIDSVNGGAIDFRRVTPGVLPPGSVPSASLVLLLAAPLHAPGATLQVEAGPGIFALGAGGSIADMRIEGPAKLIGAGNGSSGGTLSNVTLATDLEVESRGRTTIQDGLVLDGGNIRLTSKSSDQGAEARLTLAGDVAISGSGEIAFEATTCTTCNRLRATGGTAFVASGVTIRGGSGTIDSVDDGAITFGRVTPGTLATNQIVLTGAFRGAGATLQVDAGTGSFAVGVGGSIADTRIEGAGKVLGVGSGSSGGVFSNVTLATTLEVGPLGRATIQDGLVLDGGNIRIASDVEGSDALLTLSGPQAITGTGEIVFDSGLGGGAGCTACNRLRVADGTTALASGVPVRGGSGRIESASGGALFFDRVVPGTWWQHRILLTGAFRGDGATMQVEAGAGSFAVGAGGSIADTRIEGPGKVVGAGSGSSGGTLSNVTLATTFEIEPFGRTTVQDGLALDGGSLRIASIGPDPALLALSGTQTITGAGEIVFDSGFTVGCPSCNQMQVSGGTTTVDSGVTIRGGDGMIDSANGGVLVNQGMILADNPGSHSILLALSPATFTNQGTIGAKRRGASGTATLSLGFAGPLDGNVLAGIGGTISRSGALSFAPTARLVVEIGATQRGLVSVSGGTVTVGGALAPLLVGGYLPPHLSLHRFLTGTSAGSFATIEDAADGYTFTVEPMTSPTGLGVRASED